MRLLPLCLVLLAACTAGTSLQPPQLIEPTDRPGEPVATAAPPIVVATPRPEFWVEAPIVGDPSPVYAQIPATGIELEGDSVRLLRPPVTDSPRRVAIQAGHWRVEEAPAEFPNLRFSGGAEFAGVREVEVTLDIAQRLAGVLRARGYTVDVLPATVPPSYLADVFVSLHADGDVTQTARGFKIAHGTYRSPFDAALLDHLNEHFAAGTGLPMSRPITADMLDYYAFAWFRYEHALAPHTPAAIIELGFLSHAADRELLVNEPDRVARSIAEGIIRFLDANPRSALFGSEIIVPRVTAPPATPSPSP